MNIVFIIIGFVMMFVGSHFLIDGASSLSKKMKIPPLIIGLTIVAFGTSLPELFVNIISNFDGRAEIAMGDILGANIANIFLILGISSMIYPLVFKKSTAYREIPIMLGVTLTLWGLINFTKDSTGLYSLTNFNGLILLFIFFGFLFYVFILSKDRSAKESFKIDELTWTKSLVFLVIGFASLLVGGKISVENAVVIANNLNVSQSTIGLTVVAFGTTLPELFTSTVAAYEKKFDIAIGNVIGSVIFNTTAILGVSAFTRSMSFSQNFIVPFMMLTAGAILLFIFLMIDKKLVLERWQGLVMVLISIFYLASLIRL